MKKLIIGMLICSMLAAEEPTCFEDGTCMDLKPKERTTDNIILIKKGEDMEVKCVENDGGLPPVLWIVIGATAASVAYGALWYSKNKK